MADIRHIIDHSIELAEDIMSMTSGLRFQDIEVKYEYSEDLPELPCYITKLQQVFLSLIRHACSALGRVDDIDHVPTIRVAVTSLYDDIWIRFHHNGEAVSNEQQKYLFESVAEADIDSNQQSSGQRLSFSHFIITEQHQGQIAVMSDNQETTFSIQLPTK